MQVLEPRPHRWIRLTTDAQIRSPAAHTVPHSCTFHPHRSSFAELARSYALFAPRSLSPRTARMLSSACSHSALELLVVRIREAGTHTELDAQPCRPFDSGVRSALSFAELLCSHDTFAELAPWFADLSFARLVILPFAQLLFRSAPRPLDSIFTLNFVVCFALSSAQLCQTRLQIHRSQVWSAQRSSFAQLGLSRRS
ncbi:uncharacterized protein PAN0_011d4379 [Moesziomyces antarcticus]|uniref:Uncharacterized protein n=2 Tax=Pseudozyma antarctica TaxID=84753 RepID=A0A081CHL1_PSEA2|nr:uncharacterized protein PAN0_011d4379 [Moesziomyces antarcticus]GAK66157.1 hypothetical protein PAN0_011d4379 [Moesziomyces antarcticus]SPO46935.1 uncharacterized protein PSANT_04621 [Moesziomyces antarcticus]